MKKLIYFIFIWVKMLDILPNIFQHIDDGYTYRNIIYASKTFHDIMVCHYPSKRYDVYNQATSMMNRLPHVQWHHINYVVKNPSYDWDWKYLSHTTDISMIMLYDYLPWDWKIISRKTKMNYVLDYPTMPWDFGHLSFNKNVTIDVIKQYCNRNWDWIILSANKNITYNDIINNRLPWVTSFILTNASVTTDDILYSLKMKQIRWNINCLSYKLSIDDLIRHGYNIDWRKMSMNDSVTINILEQYIDKPWNWIVLSTKKWITMAFIERYINKPWDWAKLSKNKNITLDFILLHSDKPWNWNFVSINKDITIGILLTYRHLPWNWLRISAGQSLQIILSHPELPWRWKGVSINKNITIDFVIQNPQYKWNWDGLSMVVATMDDVLKYPNAPWNYKLLYINFNRL